MFPPGYDHNDFMATLALVHMMYRQANVCLVKVKNLNKVWNMFTVNNKDTRTLPLVLLILNIVNIDILNVEHLSHLFYDMLKSLTLNR